MSAALVDFRDPTIPLPSFLLVDTSVWLQALRPHVVQQTPYHQDAKNFVKRLEQEAIAGTVVPLVTVAVLEECIFKILASNFATVAISRGLHPRQWPEVYKDSPDLIESQFYSQVEQFYHALCGIPVWIVEPEDVCTEQAVQVALNETMRSYIKRFNLLPQDALNLAIASRLDVKDVAAIDADWHRADGFTVYTCLV